MLIFFKTTLLASVLLCVSCEKKSELAIPGTLEWNRIELVATSSQPINKIFVKEGDHVEANQVLMQLNDKIARAELELATAAVNQSKAALASIIRGPRKELVNVNRAKLNALQSQLANAKRTLERIRVLKEKNVTSTSDLDTAQVNVDLLSAQERELILQLDADISGAPLEETESSMQQVAQAEALASEKTIILDRLTIRAPMSGIIDSIPYREGEQPQQNSKVIIMLMDTKPFARIYAPQSHRGNLSINQSLTISLNNQTFKGHIRRLSGEPVFTPYYALTQDNLSRLAYLVEIDIDDPLPNSSLAGMPLSVTLP